MADEAVVKVEPLALSEVGIYLYRSDDPVPLTLSMDMPENSVIWFLASNDTVQSLNRHEAERLYRDLAERLKDPR